MAWYRVYFLNSHGKIEQAQVIEADNDAAAVSMAELLLDSIREICSGFDVWQGDRHVVRETQPPSVPSKRLAEITEKMQDSLLEYAQALRDSHVLLSRSRRLLQRIEELRRLIEARTRCSGPKSMRGEGSHQSSK
jgi:hypothetical protein